MRILMVTNTFTPHVGGVARSVEAFTREFRARGHEVMTIAPEFEGMPEVELNVLRIPAIQKFNGSDFSVVLPFSESVVEPIRDFNPDIVHSHHPFLLGFTAMRAAEFMDVPLVFTHHTMYEQYGHYVPGDSALLRNFAIRLTTAYANLCNQVVAPSASVKEVLIERGIRTPVEVIPTGVDLAYHSRGNGRGFKLAMGIPEDAFLVGHLGRLAHEKNLIFLAEAVARFLRKRPQAHFLLVGGGDAEDEVRAIFHRTKTEDRVHHAGTLGGPLKASAYQAMDVFAFSSRSETQGMVLTEAMAAGTPAVGLDAPGVREVIRDGFNGRLLPHDSVREFAEALQWLADLDEAGRRELSAGARSTAGEFSMERTAGQALAMYERLIGANYAKSQPDFDLWSAAGRVILREWDLIRGVAGAAAEAAGDALGEPGSSGGPVR